MKEHDAIEREQQVAALGAIVDRSPPAPLVLPEPLYRACRSMGYETHLGQPYVCDVRMPDGAGLFRRIVRELRIRWQTAVWVSLLMDARREAQRLREQHQRAQVYYDARMIEQRKLGVAKAADAAGRAAIELGRGDLS